MQICKPTPRIGKLAHRNEIQSSVSDRSRIIIDQRGMDLSPSAGCTGRFNPKGATLNTNDLSTLPLKAKKPRGSTPIAVENIPNPIPNQEGGKQKKVLK